MLLIKKTTVFLVGMLLSLSLLLIPACIWQYRLAEAVPEVLEGESYPSLPQEQKAVVEPPRPYIIDFQRYAEAGGSDLIDIQVWCIALSVYAEARGEPERGQVLVAQVIKNRVKSKRFPNTPCEVVYQPSRNPARPKSCQFSFVCDGIDVKLESEPEAWDKAYEIAVRVWYGLDDSFASPADHYHRCDISPSWSQEMEFRGQVGNHCWYKG